MNLINWFPSRLLLHAHALVDHGVGHDDPAHEEVLLRRGGGRENHARLARRHGHRGVHLRSQ